MKKKIILVSLLLFVISLVFTGCGNRQMFDTTFTFNYAVIRLQDNSIVEGKVQSWRDFQDGDQFQIKIDGITYLVHSINCTLMSR